MFCWGTEVLIKIKEVQDSGTTFLATPQLIWPMFNVEVPKTGSTGQVYVKKTKEKKQKKKIIVINKNKKILNFENENEL